MKKLLGEEEEEDAYVKFVRENKKFWVTFNVLTSLGSIALAVGTYLFLDYFPDDCEEQNIRLPLWFVFGMHIVNAVETIMNLTGLEMKICKGWVVCGFFIFEVTILVFMQVAFF